MIYIYYTYLIQDDWYYLKDKYFNIFPFDYREKLLKYNRWQEKQSSILGRLLLKQGILEVYDINLCFSKISYNSYKKPFIKNSSIKFNISHSGDIVVCAISEKYNLGIDIEQIRKIDIKSFDSQMNNSEYCRIFSNKNWLENFYDYWTQKEAVLKANGKGLYIDLKSFEIISGKTKLADKCYYLNEIYISQDYKCNLATNIKTEKDIIITKKVDF